METRKIIVVFLIIFCLISIPMIIIYPKGAARAGLSYGFLVLMENKFHLLLIILVGIWSSTMRNESIVLLPISFLLMLIAGAFISIDFTLYPAIKMFLLGTIMLFAITISLFREQKSLLSAFICGSFAYHMGTHHINIAPDSVNPLFFIIGMLLSDTLVITAAISLAIAVRGELFNDRE